MKLANDHALGTVHCKRTGPGHEWDLSEVDLLLLDVRHTANIRLRVHVPDDQANGHLEGCRVGHAALATLLDVVLRLVERVGHELQRGAVTKVLDGEDALKDALETEVGALFCRDAELKELLVALTLDTDEVLSVEGSLGLAEVPAESEVVGKQVGHAGSWCVVAWHVAVDAHGNWRFKSEEVYRQAPSGRPSQG